ncbi:MAG: substrate-binding domain-containing protein [Anaerolineae bacterium]|jgi:DNA-binding LacI/PurR family transcriptional regulator/putative methionine-R-sulfoxide reductase with GAF domain
MNPKTPNAQDHRPTIGLFVALIENVNTSRLWAGVADAAQEHDVNLLCFPGGRLHVPGGLDDQSNILFELVSAEKIDGLIIWASAISTFVAREEMLHFCRRYGLPIVTVGDVLEGIPGVLLDSYSAMYKSIAHLIESHGRCRLAFLRGPRGHREAEERYRAYTDALEAHNIPLNPNLVVGPIQWEQGAEGIRVLLDQRRLRPSVDFDAIVASSDLLALGLLGTLQEREIHVPHDVALIGFDDHTDSPLITPPLTTASNAFYERGKQTVEMLLALMRGEDVPEAVTIPAELVVRQSCGCPGSAVAQAAVGPVEHAATKGAFAPALAAQKGEIQAAMIQATSDIENAAEWTTQLLEAFLAEIGATAGKMQKPSGGFLSKLDEVLRQTMARGSDVDMWHSVISALRRQVLPYLIEEESAALQAEDLWQQARMLIGEVAERRRAFLALQEGQRSLALLHVSQTLAAASSVPELADALVKELLHLDIAHCYLALYEDPRPYAYSQPAPEWSRLVLAYDGDREGQIELAEGGQRFPSRQLLPEGILPQDRRYSLVAKPLFFRERQWGFALFKADTDDMVAGKRDTYETLRGEISSALHGISLIEQVESRLFLIRTAAEVSQVASSILDPRDLIYQVVELVRERFDLYYVGLFLVETEEIAERVTKRAYLQAGTGQAGRKMTKQRYQLEVGGESMVGQCIATGQPRVALDVGQEAVRFSNPLLPDTHSELALPLISRGEAIGALTVQSSREAAFTEESVAVFQLMTDLLANTIENARLFGQTQEALKEIESFQRLQVRDTWSRHISRQEQ